MLITTILFFIMAILLGIFFGVRIEQHINKDFAKLYKEKSELLNIKNFEASTYEKKYKEYYIRSLKAENELIEFKNHLLNFEKEKLKELKLQEDKVIELTLYLDRQKAINEQLKDALDKHLRNSCYECVNRVDEDTYINDCGECPDAAARKILGGVLVG